MKTDDLIAMLAANVTPIDRGAPYRRFMGALLAGLVISTMLMLMALGLNPALPTLPSQHALFWIKFAFPGMVAVTAWPLVQRLVRPGMKLGWSASAWSAPLAAMLLLALWALCDAAALDRPALVLGSTWQVCSIGIAFVSLPVLVATLWAMKQLAPTRLRLAGASAGLLAGALGAVVYAFHCPEVAPPFLLIWNGLGMLISTALGAALGSRWLRW